MSVRSRLTRLLGRRPASPARPVLQEVKTDLIDRAAAHGMRSFADLGGVWAVEGGYTFYALEHHDIERACLVDTGVTGTVRERARAFPRLRLVDGDFGDPATPGEVGHVDAVFLFDVLLHQVRPDWDEVLAMYAEVADLMLVVNPQFRGDETVRLLDLGREEYLHTVPQLPLHDEVFSRLDEIHPVYGRPYRDIHEIWQWGITDADLERVMSGLGYRCVYDRNTGPWFGLHRFTGRAFLYARERR